MTPSKQTGGSRPPLASLHHFCVPDAGITPAGGEGVQFVAYGFVNRNPAGAGELFAAAFGGATGAARISLTGAAGAPDTPRGGINTGLALVGVGIGMGTGIDGAGAIGTAPDPGLGIWSGLG